MTTARTNPFADLSDFEAKPATSPATPIEPAVIERVAEDHGFPSRQAARAGKPAPLASKRGRRYTTGRNQQINIKATSASIQRLYKIADARHLPLGEVLELALDALDGQGTVTSKD